MLYWILYVGNSFGCRKFSFHMEQTHLSWSQACIKIFWRSLRPMRKKKCNQKGERLDIFILRVEGNRFRPDKLLEPKLTDIRSITIFTSSKHNTAPNCKTRDFSLKVQDGI